MPDHLTAAADFIARGENYYRRAADEIVAAMREDTTLSYREVGRRLDRDESWVRRLVQWRTSAAPATPFGGPAERARRDDLAARKVLRERPEVIASALADAEPDVRERVVDRLVSTPKGASVVLGAARQLRAHEARPPAVEPLPSPPSFSAAFWRAVTAVDVAYDVLDRYGVGDALVEPETREAAERLRREAGELAAAVIESAIEASM